MNRPIGYFTARRWLKALEAFKAMAESYWRSVEMIPGGGNSWMRGPDAPLWLETDDSLRLRQQIHQAEAEVIAISKDLLVDVMGFSEPAPMIGGTVIPFNFLGRICNTFVGHSHVSIDQVRDAIDRTIGAAKAAEDAAWRRLVNPAYWLIDGPALIVSWPFLVLKAAGVPARVIESTAASVIQGILKVLISMSLGGAFMWKLIEALAAFFS